MSSDLLGYILPVVHPLSTPSFSDLDCNAKDFKGVKLDYCKVQGDPIKVADACKANPACKAFTIVNNGMEGYLKTATGPTRYLENAAVFTP